MTTKWVNQPKVKEGFDMFGTNYFQNVERQIKIPGLENIIKELTKYLKKLGNPMKKIDEGFEDFIRTLLLLLLGQVNCNTGKLTNRNMSFLDETAKGFTWASGQMNLLNSNYIRPSINTIDEQYNSANNSRYAYDIVKNKLTEGFSIQENSQLKTTIDSFMKTHPKITNMTALSRHYISELNQYEASIGTKPTSDQLFIFNNEFDNQLEDIDIIQKIRNIESELPNESYPNTIEGYKSFLSETARFVFDPSDNSEEYVFYPLNIEYFPYPTNLTGFEDILSNVNDENLISKLNSILLNVNSPSLPPSPPPPTNTVDKNYAFSVNMKITQTAPLLS